MAKLTFAQRYREDKLFRQAVEDLKTEAILYNLGFNPEIVVESWDGKRLNLQRPWVEEDAPAKKRGRPRKAATAESEEGTE